MSWQAALVRWAIRRKLSSGDGNQDLIFGVPRPAAAYSDDFVEKVRRTLTDATSSMPPPLRGSRIETEVSGPVRGEWIRGPKVADDTRRTILYFHGGGYFWGDLSAPRNMLSRLSLLTGARIFSVDYRLAPEHPVPAALEDALTAHAWLENDHKVEPAHLIVGGESAGGGLALTLLQALKKKNAPQPGAAFVYSPWADLSLSGDSIKSNSGSDIMITADSLDWAATLYLNGENAKTFPASPLFSDLSGLPPLLIQAGSTESLLDDATRLNDAIADASGRSTLEIWPNMHHVWQLHSFFLPEGRKALASTARFLETALTR